MQKADNHYDADMTMIRIQALEWIQGTIGDLILNNVPTDWPVYHDDDLTIMCCHMPQRNLVFLCPCMVIGSNGHIALLLEYEECCEHDYAFLDTLPAGQQNHT